MWSLAWTLVLVDYDCHFIFRHIMVAVFNHWTGLDYWTPLNFSTVTTFCAYLFTYVRYDHMLNAIMYSSYHAYVLNLLM